MTLFLYIKFSNSVYIVKNKIDLLHKYNLISLNFFKSETWVGLSIKVTP